MRWLGFSLIFGCSFEHGISAPDGPHPSSDAAAQDATTADAPAGCTTIGLTCNNPVVIGAVACNGGCWARCQSLNQITQAQASAACASWGGKLAPIRDANDESCVALMLFPGQPSWNGLEQASTATALAQDWSWNSDGAPLTYTHWDVFQPDDANGNENGAEQCSMVNSLGMWWDVPCGNTLYRFSCRR